jgi:hypothetical protein
LTPPARPWPSGAWLTGLADRSHRPARQPRQLDAEIEALICQLRGPQTLVAAGVDEHPGRDRPGATRHHATQQSGIGHLQIGYRQWPVGLVMIAMGSRTQWRPLCLNS